MNKKLLVGIVVLFLIGGAGALYFKSNRTANTPIPQATTETKTQTPAPAQKSLKDLLTLNQSQECSFTDDSGNSGTVLVSNGKVRSDFTVESEGKQIKSHTIVDGQTVYFWMDGQTTGYKMPITAPSAKPAATPQTPEQVNIDQKVDYNCKSWAPNNMVFNIPSEIKFTDFGSLVTPQTNQPGTQNVPSAQCATCESLTGEAKTQCKTALKCN